MKFYVYAALAVGYVAIHVYAFNYAYQSGKQSVLSKLQDDRIRILEDGKEIDSRVLSADDSSLICMLTDC